MVAVLHLSSSARADIHVDPAAVADSSGCGPAAPPWPGRGRRLARTAAFGLALAAGFAAVAGTADAAPFTNGDFEQPRIGSAFQGFDATGGAPPGWTAAGGAGYVWNVPWLHQNHYYSTEAASGDQYVGLQRSGQLGSISQTFDTVPGQTYLVGFDLSATSEYKDGTNPPQTFTLAASAAGATQDFSITTAGMAFTGLWMGNDPWTAEAFGFVANDTSTTLTFANLTLYTRVGDYGTAIDDVTVTPAAVPPVCVPEPAPVLLIGASAACLLLARPRRRQPTVLTDGYRNRKQRIGSLRVAAVETGRNGGRTLHEMALRYSDGDRPQHCGRDDTHHAR